MNYEWAKAKPDKEFLNSKLRKILPGRRNAVILFAGD